MPGERKPGMDHDLYEWSPIIARPALKWPDNARVALCIIVCLEHYEWRPSPDAYAPPNLTGYLGRRPFPDITNFSHREYGNRLGIFRLMEVLDKYGIRATAAVNAKVADHQPFLIPKCLDRGWEFIGHGITANRMITSQMSEEQEREYIMESLGALERATGRRPVGWFGPEYGESSRTPALLTEEGVRYLCDWPNDEQPYPLKVPVGKMTSLPLMFELDDSIALWNRRLLPSRWARMLMEAFDVLYQDGGRSGRLLALNLHPWIIGQPTRISYLDGALEYISRRAGVWKATGQEIIDWCQANR